MPAFLLALIARTGIPSRFTKLAAWAAVALLVVAVFALIVAGYRRAQQNRIDDAIEKHDSDLSAEAANRVMAADRAVTANEMQRQGERATQDKELTNAASRNDGRAVRSVLDELRDQQAQGRR